jgi:RimJ/RimL family protein N-acetyltransferase
MFPEITRDDVFRLETRRLWLRWPRAADAPAIAMAVSRRELADMTARIPHPYPQGAADAWVLDARRANATGDSLHLVASLGRGKREVVGAITATPTDMPGTLEIGYWIDPVQWGQGFATEAVQTFVDAVFSITECRELEAAVRVINPASQRVLRKAGFTWHGSSLRPMPARGGAFPAEHFCLDRATWRSLKGWGDHKVIRRDATTPQMEACTPA